MGKTRNKGGTVARCAVCQQEFAPNEKPYISKQASMEGTYHWSCFIETCRNRVPVSIGSFEGPTPGVDSEETEAESTPASVED